MIVDQKILLRLQALAKKAVDESSSEAERQTSAMMLVRELRKIGFFEAKMLSLDEPDVSTLPPRRSGTVVDVPQADFRRRPPPRRSGGGFVAFDPPEWGKKPRRVP